MEDLNAIKEIVFKNNLTFEVGTEFGDNYVFGKNCKFECACSFCRNCIFDNNCIFNKYCSFISLTIKLAISKTVLNSQLFKKHN